LFKPVLVGLGAFIFSDLYLTQNTTFYHHGFYTIEIFEILRFVMFFTPTIPHKFLHHRNFHFFVG
jgi:hypothetical protein